MDFFSAYTWLSLIALLLLVEALTVNLVTIWFAFGALAALLVSFITPNPTVQTAVFISISAILVFATLPFVKKMRSKKATRLNADRNLGRSAIVIEAIPAGEQGRVRLDGVDWTAVCAVPLSEGMPCHVVAINSTVLTVAPTPQTATV